MDARVLDDPENKRAKVTSKDRLLGQILGYAPQRWADDVRAGPSKA